MELSHLLPCTECTLWSQTISRQQTSSAVTHDGHVCCVTQWTCLLSDTADTPAV